MKIKKLKPAKLAGFEIKNFKWLSIGSEGFNGYQGKAYYKGKLLTEFANYGDGAPTRFDIFETNPLVQEFYAEVCKSEWYESFIAREKEWAEEFQREYEKPNLYKTVEDFIDYAAEELGEAKDFEKNQKKGLLLGAPEYPDNYDGPELPNGQMIKWKGKTIEQLLATPQGKQAILNAITEYTKQGYVILNKNLGDLLK